MDLSYLACHYLVIKVKIIYGNTTTLYSPPVYLCAESNDQCMCQCYQGYMNTLFLLLGAPMLVEDCDKEFMEKLNVKIAQLENKWVILSICLL